MNAPGYIVTGHLGPMAESEIRREGLFWSGSATVFRDRRSASRAIQYTIRRRRDDGFDDCDWMKMRVVRLQPRHEPTPEVPHA